MKLPVFHDSRIIGVFHRYHDLIIVIELDYFLENVKMGKKLFTFYLKECKRSKYWHDYIKKYFIAGIKYRGHNWNVDIDKLKLRKKELTIYSHDGSSLAAIGTFGGKDAGRLHIPKKLRIKRAVKIQFESMKAN